VATPPGWYSDPYTGQGARWWDGTRWTDATEQPQVDLAQPSSQSTRKPWVVRTQHTVAIAPQNAYAKLIHPLGWAALTPRTKLIGEPLALPDGRWRVATSTHYLGTRTQASVELVDSSPVFVRLVASDVERSLPGVILQATLADEMLWQLSADPSGTDVVVTSTWMQPTLALRLNGAFARLQVRSQVRAQIRRLEDAWTDPG
jgi:hypothetical protein